MQAFVLLEIEKNVRQQSRLSHRCVAKSIFKFRFLFLSQFLSRTDEQTATISIILVSLLARHMGSLFAAIRLVKGIMTLEQNVYWLIKKFFSQIDNDGNFMFFFSLFANLLGARLLLEDRLKRQKKLSDDDDVCF